MNTKIITSDDFKPVSLNNNIHAVIPQNYSADEPSLRIIHLKSRGSILAFGGCEYLGGYDHSMYEYDIKQNIWFKLGIERPIELGSCYDIVVTRDERYIICLGGLKQEEDYNIIVNDDIWVVDTNTIDDHESGVFRRSKMRLPQPGKCKAVIVNNRYDDELLVFGYFRNNHDYKDFPEELVRLMVEWMSIEYIHVFMRNAESNKRERDYLHWKISVDLII